MADNDLMVTIRCITYNHEPYIRQCLEGFVIQKTNFKFEVIVHDDASTDGTADIIREYAKKYPNIVKPILEIENQYSKHEGSIIRILNDNTYGKYIAVCEGDDYWIDPYKLQKQIDFLESHPDYGVVHTDYKVFNQKNGTYLSPGRITNIDGDAINDLLLGKSYIATLTSCYRKSLLDEIDISYKKENFMMGDYPLWIEMSRKCKIKYLPDVTAVYRELENSASHSLDFGKNLMFYTNVREVRHYFVEKYHINEIKKEVNKEYYFYMSQKYLYLGNYLKCFSMFGKNILYSVKNFKLYLIVLWNKYKRFK